MNFTDYNKFINAFADEEACRIHLEKITWNGIVVSPFLDNSKVYYCKNGKYKCRESGKYFNVRTKTIFHHSKISLHKWFAAIWLLSKSESGITSVQMAKNLEISQKTAWLMIRRIKRHFDIQTLTQFPETEELDYVEVIIENDKLKMTDWLNILKR